MGVRELDYYLDDFPDSSGNFAGEYERLSVRGPDGYLSAPTVLSPVRRPVRPSTDRPASGLAVVTPLPRVVGCPDPLPIDTGYRMGRWARLATSVTVLLAGAAVALTLSTGSTPGRTAEITVLPGDTLYSVAAAVGGGSDTANVMDRIRELNGSELTDLQAGSIITVPAAG